MKKLLFILPVILLPHIVCAQKIHFTDTTNVWNQFYDIYNDNNPPIYQYSTHQYSRDTVIHSVNYRIFDFGAVREDTLLKKVYLRDLVNDSDIVLMDYTLNVGDTFITPATDTYYHHTYNYVVSAIDSTMINGVWHRVWHFPAIHYDNGLNWPSTLIEGIGCIQHPTYMMWHGLGIEPIDPRVYCFSNNGSTPTVVPAVRYANFSTSAFDNAGTCSYYPHLSVNDPHSNKLRVYPNPATTDLNIMASGNISNITITNTLGQTIFTHEYNTEKAQINVSGLPAGIYFIRINGTEVRKFIKQ